MAEKPKTYPQQIQELKGNLAASQERIAELEKQLSDTIPTLQAENQKLKDTVAELAKTDRQSSVSDKSKLTDLQQRAESAEKAARVAQQGYAQVKAELQQLEALREYTAEVERALASKEANIEVLYGQYKNAEAKVLQFQREASDRVSEAQREVESMSGELKQLRMSVRGYQNEIVSLKDKASTDLTIMTQNMDRLATQAAELEGRNMLHEEVIRRFYDILESVPDTKAQLTALLDRVQIAESTVT